MRSPSMPSAALGMLRELAAVDSFSDRLEGTAPVTVLSAGGAAALVSAYGRQSGARFWTLAGMPPDLWEAMARENQEPHRGNGLGD